MRCKNYMFAAALFICAVGAQATELLLRSTEAQTGLLELYTSEGCSSCPPADRWLSKLKDQEGVWDKFVPIAFHVDYWNYIGWKDRFSSKEYSARQRRYEQEDAIPTVYTPGFVYNGLEWREWFGLKSLRFPQANAAGVLEAQIEREIVRVEYTPDRAKPKEGYVHIALLGFELNTRVEAGENSGKRLHHDFVVLALDSQKMQQREDVLTATMNLPESSIDDVPRYGVAIWVTDSTSQIPLQAVGGWLPLSTSLASN